MRLTVAQALVRFLAQQYTERNGIRQRLITATWGIFGHGNVAGLGQALVEYGDEMPFHQGRNEQAMVHAAVGYARHSRRLSTHAVTTSIGPGATNLVTGAALATINHLPVLLLPGDVFAARPADPVLQQLEVPYAGDVSVNDCLRPVSKYFDRVTRPEALIPAALSAMRVLADPVDTGAVTLALPQDVQAEAWEWPEEFFRERVWRVARPEVHDRDLYEALELIRASRRPLIIAGGGVRHAGAEYTLQVLAESTGIPVASTQAGKGSLRHDHPADVGGIGHTGTLTANALARTADLVLGIGTRYTDFTTASGSLFDNPDVRFVNLNIAGFDSHKMGAVSLVGDAHTGMAQLRRLLREHTIDTVVTPAYRVPATYEAEYTEAKADWESQVTGAYAAPDPEARPTQIQLLGALDELAEDRDVLINAAGSLPGDLHKLWRTRGRDQYHVEYGYSCMGYEIPAAIGVKLAEPGREVWALVGDGTYLMNPTELVTAVQEGIAIKVVILQNHGYASIGGLSESVGAERFATAYRMRAADGSYTGEPLPVDLGANAESLGMRVLRAGTVRELRETLREARAADVPTCVYVETGSADTVSGVPSGQAWWDVPVAETASRKAAVEARRTYERRVQARRRHL
ncbi:3D-(3,5/4)-trihydroxycyclohexane-1,2-dione acylhydrolase (decyclizing) [Streptomyces sp. NPDC050418]|uniref:3D-(3,5/4)-trihydroxycyclohexane-1,2-dione acylhydrolase (decyclizing) n=1 Tax=Streptomyces sp. NPDC050418 TaxID=3365612 RepID=UPI0037956ECD